jgi:hypothetical protein
MTPCQHRTEPLMDQSAYNGDGVRTQLNLLLASRYAVLEVGPAYDRLKEILR